MNKEIILEVKDLSVKFDTPEGVVTAVESCDFELGQDEIIAIVGESGSGKTITALSIMRLLPSHRSQLISGEIFFKKRDLLKLNESDMRRIRGDQISMIFQNPRSSLNPIMSIGKQITEAILLHQKVSKKEAKIKTIEYLDMVKIPRAKERMRNYPHQFSGGMCQRVMIAMALSSSPDILIADEPTTALDVTIESQILELILDLKKEFRSSVILISHDLGVVARMAERVIVMYAGKPVEFGEAEHIFYRSSHPYTRGLLASITSLEGDAGKSITPIGGVPPSPLDLPPGCNFSPRCQFTEEICIKNDPILMQVEKDHSAACHFSSKIDVGKGSA